MKEKTGRKKSIVREYAETIGIAVVLALVIRTFVVQAFRIPSGSMEDTLLVGDFLLASKFIYGSKIPFLNIRLPSIRDPEPGDVIIFKYPEDPSRDFIKRCVAVPGQTVEIRDKALYVDSQPLPDPPLAKYVDPKIYPKGYGVRDNHDPVRVPAGQVFVMGDNRDNSRDSRYWGFVPIENVKGKAMILYWSWSPDRRAPQYRNLLSVPEMFFYNLIRFPWRVRWARIGTMIN